jgi:phosphatidylinositol-3-phosphatase
MIPRGRRLRLLARLGVAGALALTLLALVVPQVLANRGGSGDENRRQVRHFDHIFVIMMENTGFDSLIGNANAPFINSAAARFGLARNYFGVTHPSQPNYIAATSGGQNGVTNDNDVTIDVPNIVDQLEGHHKTWKGYMQSIFAGGNTDKLAHAAGNQLYERKHNPFVSYLDVQTNPARMANIVDLSQLDTDLASGHVPNYAWISPDQCHDMHGRGGGGAADPCDFSNEQNLIATGDAFLAQTVGAIMSSKVWNDESAILITWDESDFTGTGPAGFGDTRGCCDADPGGGHVVTLAITGDKGARPRGSDVAYNHYSLLATVQDSFKLGCLGFTCDTANVHPMADLVNKHD